MAQIWLLLCGRGKSSDFQRQDHKTGADSGADRDTPGGVLQGRDQNEKPWVSVMAVTACGPELTVLKRKVGKI